MPAKKKQAAAVEGEPAEKKSRKARAPRESQKVSPEGDAPQEPPPAEVQEGATKGTSPPAEQKTRKPRAPRSAQAQPPCPKSGAMLKAFGGINCVAHISCQR